MSSISANFRQLNSSYTCPLPVPCSSASNLLIEVRCMAEIKEAMNVDTCSTKNICPPDDDGSLVIVDIPRELEPDLSKTCWTHRVTSTLRKEAMNVNTCPRKNICPDHDDESSVIMDIPEESEPDVSKTCWIFRVPRKLRQQNKAAYTPQIVSIGPSHHGKPKFEAMEAHKTKYQQRFWERDFCKHILEDKKVNHATKDFLREVCYEFMTDDRIERVRRCYAGFSERKMKEATVHFPDVIFRDACFIFELFLRYTHHNGKDYILRTQWLAEGIRQDLILLENQLPFFVFEELFDFILDSQPKNSSHRPDLSARQTKDARRASLLSLAMVFFCNYYYNGKAPDEEMQNKERFTDSGGGGSDAAGQDGQAQTSDRPAVSGATACFATIKHFTDLLRDLNLGGGGGRSDPVGRDDQATIKHLLDLLGRFTRGDSQAQTLYNATERFKDIKHFTDLVREFMLPKECLKPDDQKTYLKPDAQKTIICNYSAKKLDRAGVNFIHCENRYFAHITTKPDHKKESKHKCLMSSTSLQVVVPKFTVDDRTECVMRNVMALEQCLYPTEPRICDYIGLLDQLINTAEDVGLLIEKKILQNMLGSDEAAANLFNKLCDQIAVGVSCNCISKKLNRHYNSCWGQTKATLRRVYFKDLWTGSSTVVAFVVFLFSIVNITATIRHMT